MLWHQIPEDRRLERSRLARRLRFLGFGSVQDSVWVSPHDQAVEVARLIEELDVSDCTTVFGALVGAARGVAATGSGVRARGAAGLAALVARAWDLSGLVERYEAFDAEFSPYSRPAARARLQDSEAFLVRMRMVHLFRGFPTLDPKLPEELAPLSRPRMQAVNTFHSLFDSLAEPSQRHFDAATVVPAEKTAVTSRETSTAGASLEGRPRSAPISDERRDLPGSSPRHECPHAARAAGAPDQLQR